MSECGTDGVPLQDISSLSEEGVAQHVEEIVSSQDAGRVCAACTGLVEVLEKGSASLQLLKEKEVVKVLLRKMDNVSSHPATMEACCELLMTCNEFVDLRYSLEDLKAYRKIVKVLEMHKQNERVSAKALDAISSLATSALNKTAYREDKVYLKVLESLQLHGENSSVQRSGFLSLSILLEMDSFAASHMAMKGDVMWLLTAMKRHASHPDVVSFAFRCFTYMVKCTSQLESLQELRVNVPYFLHVLKNNQAHEDIICSTLMLLEALSVCEVQEFSVFGSQSLLDLRSLDSLQDDTVVRGYLKNQKVLELLQELLEIHLNTAEVLVHGFKIFYSLFTLARLEVMRPMQVNWLRLLHKGLDRHRENLEVSEASCFLLSVLLIVYSDLSSYIGDQENQFPFYNHLWLILLRLSYSPNSTVFAVTCSAFYYMVESNDHLQHLLLKKGAAVVLTECLRGYINDRVVRLECIENGCRALRGLLGNRHCEEEKEYLLDIGIFSDIHIVLNECSEIQSIVVEALCLVGCLADLDKFQCMIKNHGFLKSIIENVKCYVSNEIVVEIALEILIVLSLNEEMIQYFGDNDVLGLTVNMMNKHVTCPDIQFKGCMLIRLLFDFLLHSESLYDGIAKAVVDALSRKVYRKVQCEALACAQTLCKASPQMAQCLVNRDIHILLFALLYHDESDTGNQRTSFLETSLDAEEKANNFFLEVGTDIIYTLSFEYNFMQQMLINTVKDGVIEGIKVLIEIGVDLNFGEMKQRPICLAVESENVESIKTLLHYGISHDSVKAALVISLERKLDVITGLLLEHIAVDRSRDIVSLRGLELPTLKPLWVLPSLGYKMTKGVRGHRRIRSLGPLKESLLHRKSIASEVSCGTVEPQVYSSRRQSIDITALKYLNLPKDSSDQEPIDEVDFGGKADLSEAKAAEPELKVDEDSLSVSDIFITSNGQPKSPSLEMSLKSNSLDRSLMSNSLIMPKGSFRKPTVGTVSGALCLPQGQLDQYVQEDVDGGGDYFSAFGKDNPMSPAQLCKQLRKYQKKRKHSTVPESSQYYPRLDPKLAVNLAQKFNESISDSSMSDNSYNISSSTKPSLMRTESKSANSSPVMPLSAGEKKKLNRKYSEGNLPMYGTADTGSDAASGGASSEQDEGAGSTHFVKVLDMSSNHFRDFSDLENLSYGGVFLFKHLKDVRKLDVRHNALTELPEAMMREMGKLSVLLLSNNKFTSFPVGPSCSRTLVEIDVSSNMIAEVPPLPTMKNLTKLNLSHNHLTAMPVCTSKCSKYPSFPSLVHFDLRDNRISSIPNPLVKLDNLEVLFLSKNKLQSLPAEFLADIKSVKTLDLSSNEIEQISALSGQDMVYLEELKIAHNKLFSCEAAFNTFITSAPVLQVIDASDNSLSTVPPPYAWKSLALRDIRYGKNKVAHLDLSECKRFWSRLEFLHLASNRLKEIPREIGHLRSLCCLDISDNKDIKTLPDQMGDLEHLFMLNIQGLKLHNLDPSVLSGSAKTVINYLRSRSTDTVLSYRMKLMVVGAAGKGKTTLLNQLIQTSGSGGQFKKANNLATLGVSVKPWTYQQKQLNGSSATYRITCWDFAGQEEFYTTHQCFLSQLSVYIVVYDICNGEKEIQQLKPWLHNIQARAPSSAAIVVGTHLDQLKVLQKEADKLRVAMRTKVKEVLSQPGFPCNVTYAEVDCFNHKQMSELRAKIKGLIDSAKLRGQNIMGRLIPANYLHLEKLFNEEKKRLESQKSKFPVMVESRLHQLMEEAKLSKAMDPSEVQQAVNFLHECGVILHFNDLQTKLSELYFLDPEWLCSLMAHVITLKQISFIDDRGLLDDKALPLILKEPKFPLAYIPEYIRLLERFDVVLKHADNKLLVPCRLPKAKPPTVHLERTKEQICRHYSFFYIPPGFFPRLIARIIAFPHFSSDLSSDDKLVSQTLSPCSQHLWSTGIQLYWSEESYLYLEVLPGAVNVIAIMVPLTKCGIRLFCAAVDNIESLVDEWFPGLRDPSILDGSKQIIQEALCPYCPDQSSPYHFKLNFLVDLVHTTDEVECPVHHGMVKVEYLAPDIVVGDLDIKFRLRLEDLKLEETQQHQLGKGGFADVYKASYQNKTVAVKVFSHGMASMSNTTPNQLVRQEIHILSRLSHPHIIGLVGVCTKPKAMIVMECAELKSLNNMKPYRSLSTQLKHKMAIQLSSALAYLHKNEIIYRDLKPGNILMFSTNLFDKVNLKLSDYGIACFSTPSGLTQSVGTAGYRAPELLISNSSNMPYYDKVDVYCYGLVMFELMTEGHKPFEELGTGFEIDKFIAEGRPINDINQYGCTSSPDMLDLINHCLQYIPTKRPSMAEVFVRLCNSEFVSLKKNFTVERDLVVETFAVRVYPQPNGTNSVEIWTPSILSERTMLSIFDYNGHHRGMVLPKKEVVQAITAAGPDLIVLGSAEGDLLVYDASDQKYLHCLKPLSASVMVLKYFKFQSSSYMAAGLANGDVAFYYYKTLKTAQAEGRVVNVGSYPVRDISRYHARLYVACGGEACVISQSSFLVEKTWKATKELHFPLLSIAVGPHYVWTVQDLSSQILVWDKEDYSCSKVISCESALSSVTSDTVSPSEARVLSMVLQHQPSGVLWVGLASGHILLMNSVSMRPIMATRRHVHSVCCIRLVETVLNEKPLRHILSSGFGFLQRPGSDAPKKGTPETYGSILAWNTVMPKLYDYYNEIKRDLSAYL